MPIQFDRQRIPGLAGAALAGALAGAACWNTWTLDIEIAPSPAWAPAFVLSGAGLAVLGRLAERQPRLAAALAIATGWLCLIGFLMGEPDAPVFALGVVTAAAALLLAADLLLPSPQAPRTPLFPAAIALEAAGLFFFAHLMPHAIDAYGGPLIAALAGTHYLAAAWASRRPRLRLLGVALLAVAGLSLLTPLSDATAAAGIGVALWLSTLDEMLRRRNPPPPPAAETAVMFD